VGTRVAFKMVRDRKMADYWHWGVGTYITRLDTREGEERTPEDVDFTV